MDWSFWTVFGGGLVTGWLARSYMVAVWKREAVERSRARHPSMRAMHVRRLD